ncbi:MAG: AAA family ATPase [Chloroflexi bacterium]|nr:AAA family ATPase [Chloroflexota bacterium]
MVQETAGSERPLPFFSIAPGAIPVMESPLLHTKLRVPGSMPTLLTRPRLIRQLNSYPNGHLTLISAPAGFGKTTLAMDWVRQQAAPAAWLTLDEQDNDPILFWRYLIAALQTVNPRLGQRAQAALSAFTRVSLETAVTFLINDIINSIAHDTTLTLVLDDFHWIHSAPIYQSLNYLLQHQPPQLHLLLLTRADPSLSLARLRVEGRLVELRAADLRLTPEEIAAFFNRADLNLQAEDLRQLADQTEGWVAGLQLAALSLRQRGISDAARLLQTSIGVRQHVFAYLMQEVLHRQTDEMRQFLQQTAVLHQFCAALCTAVTGQTTAPSLLRQLIADNLFITPLDDEGQWYRYHPLFAEMLRANLDESVKRECHRRAANWYAAHHLIHDAMRSALDAQDFALITRLLTQFYKTFLANGLLVSLQKWLAALPEAYQSPRLRMAAAWCRVYESNEQELRQIVTEITEASPEVDKPFQGEILAVRAIYASLYGQLDNAIQWANEALVLIDPEDFLSLAAAYLALGNVHRFQGTLDPAIAAYAQARQQFESMGNVFMGQLPLYRIASIQIMQGRLHQAWQTYESVRQRAQAAGYEPLIMTGELFGHLSDLYWEWNDLEQATAYARQEIELAQSGHMLLALVDGYLKLAAVASAQGNTAETREALRLAAETAVQFHSAPVSALVAMHQARHELARGNLMAAAAWADDYDRRRRNGTCVLTPLQAQSADLLLARIWLAHGRTDAALVSLQEAARQFQAAGRIRLEAEANVLQALAWTMQNQETAAQTALGRALTLAQHEGYIRLFVENGPALTPLLNRMRHVFPEYIPRLLAALPADATTGLAASPLFEPLTEREQEILALIALGQSNSQIASALFISVGTVKGHVNHIFGKLDVKSRTQALLRARELKLLDN